MNNVLQSILPNYTLMFYCTAVIFAIAFIPIIQDEEQSNPYQSFYKRRRRYKSILKYLSIVAYPIYTLYVLYLHIAFANTYYDYFSTRILLFTTIFIFMAAWAIAVLAYIIQQSSTNLSSLVFIFVICISPLIIPFIPDMKQDVQAFLDAPSHNKGTITNKSTSFSRYETSYVITINSRNYKVRPIWYNQLQVGQQIVFVQDPAGRMAFPLQSIQATAQGGKVQVSIVPLWIYALILFLVGINKWKERLL